MVASVIGLVSRRPAACCGQYLVNSPSVSLHLSLVTITLMVKWSLEVLPGDASLKHCRSLGRSYSRLHARFCALSPDTRVQIDLAEVIQKDA